MRYAQHLLPLVATFALGCDSANDSGLPTTFGDCASPPCEVALEAFTKNPSTLPYCPGNRGEVDLSCPAASGAQTGTCEGKWVVRYVYGFPGDFYECIYDASTGALVGAKWAPDSHPVQFAAEQIPAGCPLTSVCES